MVLSGQNEKESIRDAGESPVSGRVGVGYTSPIAWPGPRALLPTSGPSGQVASFPPPRSEAPS